MPPFSRRQFLQTSLIGLAALTSVAAGPEVSLQAPTVFNVRPAVPALALTFDDGYVNVARLLDAARKAEVRLTLFPVGQLLDRRPEVWQRAVAEGHEIGCHTYTHRALGGQPVETVRAELEQFCAAAHKQLGLEAVRLFRPPYGSGWSAPAVQQAAAEFGMTVVMWNRVSPGRQASRPSEVVQALQQSARAGDIVLYHFQAAEVAAFPRLVEHGRAQGWHVGTVSELLAAGG